MTSTGDVFLSVSAQPPETPGKTRMSLMSPLLEEEDERETEGMLSERGEDLVHPEFELDEEEKRAFMTENQRTADQNDVTEGYDIVDGVMDRDICDRLNSDGDDDVFSDSNSSGEDEPNEGDYETDLEFDEESKCDFSVLLCS